MNTFGRNNICHLGWKKESSYYNTRNKRKHSQETNGKESVIVNSFFETKSITFFVTCTLLLFDSSSVHFFCSSFLSNKESI